MKTRLIIFAVGIYCMVAGCQNVLITSTPFEGSVRMLEQNGGRKYDFFKLSKALTFPYAFYMHNPSTHSVSSFVYPLVSREYLDSISTAYILSDEDVTFEKWFDKLKNKPLVYILSDKKNLDDQSLNNLLESDTLEKSLYGTRITLMSDIEDEVKEELAKVGIDADNAIFIEEGGTPTENHGYGWLNVIIGILIVAGSVVSFLYKLGKDEETKTAA